MEADENGGTSGEWTHHSGHKTQRPTRTSDLGVHVSIITELPVEKRVGRSRTGSTTQRISPNNSLAL
jgi:hypothetical protein